MNALRSSCAARAGARVVGVEQIGFSEHAADEKERNRPIPLWSDEAMALRKCVL